MCEIIHKIRFSWGNLPFLGRGFVLWRVLSKEFWTVRSNSSDLLQNSIFSPNAAAQKCVFPNTFAEFEPKPQSFRRRTKNKYGLHSFYVGSPQEIRLFESQTILLKKFIFCCAPATDLIILYDILWYDIMFASVLFYRIVTYFLPNDETQYYGRFVNKFLVKAIISKQLANTLISD